MLLTCGCTLEGTEQCKNCPNYKAVFGNSTPTSIPTNTLQNNIPDEVMLIKCPYCGESYYLELYKTTTCLGWAPIYKNGVLQNSNPNTTTTHCRCLNCNKDFEYTK